MALMSPKSQPRSGNFLKEPSCSWLWSVGVTPVPSQAGSAPKPTFRLSPVRFDLQHSEGLLSLLSLSQPDLA